MAYDMHLQLMAIVLRRGAVIDHISSVLTLLALMIGLAPLLGVAINPVVSVAAVVMLILGMAEKYWAQRVAIDEQLFSLLAARAADFDDTVSQLDTALQRLGLAPAAVAPRSLESRSRGALRLLRWQSAFLGAQCLLTVAACIAAPWL